MAAVLVDDNSVLFCHRAPDRQWFPNVWDLPGGHVEPGEGEAAALARELAEELGIEVVVPPAPRLSIEDDALDLRMHIWVLDEWHGHPTNRAPAEHDRIAWFDVDAVDELDLADDHYRTVVRDALSPPRPA